MTKLEGGGADKKYAPGKMFALLPFPVLFYIANGKRIHRDNQPLHVPRAEYNTYLPGPWKTLMK